MGGEKKSRLECAAEMDLARLLDELTEDGLEGVLQVVEWFDAWIPQAGKSALVDVLRERWPVGDDPAADALANHEVMKGE